MCHFFVSNDEIISATSCEICEETRTLTLTQPHPPYLHVDEVEHVVGQGGDVVSVYVQLRLQVLAPQVLHPLDDLSLDPAQVGGVEPHDGVGKLFTPEII